MRSSNLSAMAQNAYAKFGEPVRTRDISLDDDAPEKPKFNPVKKTFDTINNLQLNAQKSVEEFSVGEADSIHKVVIDMEEAFLSLKLGLQLRNKAIESYQEIMRMQM